MIILTLFKPFCIRQNPWKAHLLPLHLTLYYLVGVMIVPGHVVFLWRIIHQHFTLAFLKHISTCCWNKSSRSLENSSVTKKSPEVQLDQFCPCFLWRSSRQRTNLSALLVYFSSSISWRLSVQTAYSFIEVPGAGGLKPFSPLLLITLSLLFVS